MVILRINKHGQLKAGKTQIKKGSTKSRGKAAIAKETTYKRDPDTDKIKPFPRSK